MVEDFPDAGPPRNGNGVAHKRRNRKTGERAVLFLGGSQSRTVVDCARPPFFSMLVELRICDREGGFPHTPSTVGKTCTRRRKAVSNIVGEVVMIAWL